MRIVTKSKAVKEKLNALGVSTVDYPTYPDLVLMCRHAARNYPGRGVIKIGMRHGPYHFKDFIKANYYNEFDKYFFTSPTEAIQAKERGIVNGCGVGYPKIDDAFDGSITSKQLDELRSEVKIDSSKKTIIFTATWSNTDYSTVLKWYDKLDKLTGQYNVLVTVHDWTSKEIIDKIKSTKGVFYIEDKQVLPYLMIADVLIGDVSSIIAEFSALNKPIITFRVGQVKRISSEIVQMLDEMTVRIDDFEELFSVLPLALDDKRQSIRDARIYYNDRMFGPLDGKANQRARKLIDIEITKLKNKYNK
jgi:CDP-glycerol glycerophosphotransferase (TagB/SpsB family)